jgi:seryl-tRNA synthetase
MAVALFTILIIAAIIQSYLFNKKLNSIMASQAQLAQDLRDLKAQNDKSRAEILAKIQALEDALAAAGGTTEEVDTALADLKASVQTDDDIVPDAPTP